MSGSINSQTQQSQQSQSTIIHSSTQPTTNHHQSANSTIAINSQKQTLNLSSNVLPVAAKPQAQSPHPIPPRYHPPPQPVTGILKPPLKSHVPMYPSSTSAASNHVDFQFKYPPEVPKLASLFLHQKPQSEVLPLHRPPPGRPPQIRLPPGAIQHHLPPSVPSTSVHRLTPADELSARLTANHLAAQQGQLQHSSDMLKFVRKADSDTSTTTSSNSGRLSVEQPTKQYVQVITIIVIAYCWD